MPMVQIGTQGKLEMSETFIYQYTQVDYFGLRHKWRHQGTGEYTAGFRTKEDGLKYADFHKGDGSKWIVSRETKGG